MLEGGRISPAELVTMLLYTVLGTAFFFLPSVVAGFAGRDVWLTPVPAIATGTILALVTGCLATRYPGFNFFNWTEIILGRAGGKILQFFYILWFLHSTTVIINEFVYFVQIAFMPVTPRLVFTLLLLLLTGSAVYGGVEMIGRLSIIFLPVSLVISAGLILLAAGLYDPANLTPVLEKGVTPMLAGSFVTAAWRSEIFLAAMLFPFLKRPAEGGRIVLQTDLWVAFFLLIETIAVVLAFGDETPRITLPVFSLAREINLLGFFQHLESLVLIMWYAGIFVKVTVWEYVTVLGLAQWLNLSSYRPLVLPVGLLLAAVTNYDLPDVVGLVHFVASVAPFYHLPFSLVLPGLLALVGLLRRPRPGTRRAGAGGGGGTGRGKEYLRGTGP